MPNSKRVRTFFYFLLLIPIVLLVYEIRGSLIDMREGQREMFLLNAQRASQQRLIMGLEVRILHYVENHADEHVVGCPLCFKNLMMEKYDHPMIRKFLKENGVNPEDYFSGTFIENREADKQLTAQDPISEPPD